jgi:hypothetical protein
MAPSRRQSWNSTSRNSVALINDRATLAFNPLIMISQCKDIFDAIDQCMTERQERILPARWTGLSKRQQFNEKRVFVLKLQDLIFNNGCLLCFHNFENPPTPDPGFKE